VRKYKINRTEEVKLPNAETIRKYKDFSRLRHEYDSVVKRPRKPLYRDRKLFFILLFVALLALLLAQVASEEKEDEKSDENPKTEELHETAD